MSDDTPEYAVGYKKPPVATRFQRGKSGNPKGRIKRVRNLKADLTDELAEMVTLKENGRTIRISKQRAMGKVLVSRGIKGDIRAIAKAFDLVHRLEGSDAGHEQNPALPADDVAILEAFIERMAARDHD